jgi:hypothetical protein
MGQRRELVCRSPVTRRTLAKETFLMDQPRPGRLRPPLVHAHAGAPSRRPATEPSPSVRPARSCGVPFRGALIALKPRACGPEPRRPRRKTPRWAGARRSRTLRSRTTPARAPGRRRRRRRPGPRGHLGSLRCRYLRDERRCADWDRRRSSPDRGEPSPRRNEVRPRLGSGVPRCVGRVEAAGRELDRRLWERRAAALIRRTGRARRRAAPPRRRRADRGSTSTW